MSLNVAVGNGMFKEGSSAFDAALSQGVVVFDGAARIGVANEDQAGIGPVSQIIFEIFGQGFQDLGLTVD